MTLHCRGMLLGGLDPPLDWPKSWAFAVVAESTYHSQLSPARVEAKPYAVVVSLKPAARQLMQPLGAGCQKLSPTNLMRGYDPRYKASSPSSLTQLCSSAYCNNSQVNRTAHAAQTERQRSLQGHLQLSQLVPVPEAVTTYLSDACIQCDTKCLGRGQGLGRWDERTICRHALLQHPHIINFKGLFLSEHYLCVVTEATEVCPDLVQGLKLRV